MFSVSVSAIALLLSAFPFQVAAGKAYVHNECDFDVNLWSVAANEPGTRVNISANGGIYNETYRVPNAGGISLKLTPEDNCGNKVPITQFEYTLAGGMIWYDLSDVNCVAFSEDKPCPFKQHGLYMHSRKSCPSVSCAQGTKCVDAYNAFNDDWATKACDGNADVHLYLCQTRMPLDADLAALGEIVDETEDALPVKRHAHHVRHPHSRSS